ncbi:MAG: hypothetical protein J0M24_16235 [Verrucomicrobia bacterium]|nr:hypothetical protein [Verrucomicrobiota bacterium]
MNVARLLENAWRLGWFRTLPVILLVDLAGCSSQPPPENGPLTSQAPSEPAVPTPDQPVVVTVSSLPRVVKAGESFEVQVIVELAAGYHIYATQGVRGPFTPTALEFTFPEEVESLGTWGAPEPKRDPSGEPSYWGKAVFSRLLRVRTNVPPGALSIKGKFQYQACTEELCWPPRSTLLVTSIQVTAP